MMMRFRWVPWLGNSSQDMERNNHIFGRSSLMEGMGCSRCSTYTPWAHTALDEPVYLISAQHHPENLLWKQSAQLIIRRFHLPWNPEKSVKSSSYLICRFLLSQTISFKRASIRRFEPGKALRWIQTMALYLRGMFLFRSPRGWQGG